MPNYKKRTFDICMSYLKNRNCKTKRTLLLCLRQWSKGQMEPYAYDINSVKRFRLDLEYTSDRMNAGVVRMELCIMQDIRDYGGAAEVL